MTRVRAASAVGLVGLALLLTGCFPDPPSQDGRAIPAAVTPYPEITAPAIVRYCPPMVGAHFGGVVGPLDRVYACRPDVQLATDGITTYGPWQIAYLLPHPDALLRAYAKPNAPAQPPSRCGAVIVDPLMIWVDRAGDYSAYYAPVDGCGAPTSAAARAYRTAERTVVADVDMGAPVHAEKEG